MPGHDRRRLSSSRHLGDSVDRIRAGVVAGVPALMLAWIFIELSGGPAAVGPMKTVLLLIVFPAAVMALALGLSRLAGGLAGMTRNAGDPIRRGYSLEESMVARGRLAEAERSYRDAIFDEPRSIEARLRLAALLAQTGRNLDEAETLYLEVRALDPTPAEEVVVANGLIDLYRGMGREADFRRELELFAARFGGARGVPGPAGDR